MANEARVHAEGVAKGIVRQFTVADGTAIAKGALLVYSSATRTAKAHIAAGGQQRPLGFAVEEKEANDGKTTIGLQRTGVIDAIFDGVYRTGDVVRCSPTTANRVQAVNTTAAGLSYEIVVEILGRSLEDGATTTTGKVALTLG